MKDEFTEQGATAHNFDIGVLVRQRLSERLR